MNERQLVSEMTLEEKASLLSGQNFWNTKSIPRLNIPSIMLTDGPHGLRKQAGKADHLGLNKSIPATCFPTAATLANSWDKELLWQVGSFLGHEAASEDVSVLLGPGMNIKRNPLCGRNFEYFSEDPYLTGQLATEMVKGIQSEGVSACPKHFAVNSQEHMRMTIDEIVDERALREVYLAGFEQVVKEAKPKTMMTSYNKVNGIFANEHEHLLQTILYGEWGFEGVTVTDWGGNNDRVAGLKAGNQLEMPATNGITDKEVIAAVMAGELSESVVDDAVYRLLKLVNETRPVQDKRKANHDEHHLKAVQAAEASIVLLKNRHQLLPIVSQSLVAIIGDFAEQPRYQGAGSSLINPTRLKSAKELLEQSGLNIIGYESGFDRLGKINNKKAKAAIELAQQAETILLFLGLDESSEAEGVDRKHLRLPDNQLMLVDALTALNKKVVVVLSGGGAIELPFIEQIDAVLHTYLAGQGGAEALTSILIGKVNPSGKLSETFPIRYEDVSSAPYYPGNEATAEHREGLFIGYRYFETANVPVLFPFGYGLSYTTFEYSEFQCSDSEISFRIKNVGKVAGAEIAQLYIEKKDSTIFRAKKELKGFTKVFLQPQESKIVTISLTDRDFSYYDNEIKKWLIEPGEYELQVGSSIHQIHLRHMTKLNGENGSDIYSRANYPTYYSGRVHELSDEEFIRLLGYTPPATAWNYGATLGMNDTIAQVKYRKGLGQFIYKLIYSVHRVLMKLNKPLAANNVFFVINMPFRQIERFTGGKIKKSYVQAFLNRINKAKVID